MIASFFTLQRLREPDGIGVDWDRFRDEVSSQEVSSSEEEDDDDDGMSTLSDVCALGGRGTAAAAAAAAAAAMGLSNPRLRRPFLGPSCVLPAAAGNVFFADAGDLGECTAGNLAGSV